MSPRGARGACGRHRPTAGTPGTGELKWGAISRGSVLILDMVGPVWRMSISFCVILGKQGRGDMYGGKGLCLGFFRDSKKV